MTYDKASGKHKMRILEHFEFFSDYKPLYSRVMKKNPPVRLITNRMKNF